MEAVEEGSAGVAQYNVRFHAKISTACHTAPVEAVKPT